LNLQQQCDALGIPLEIAELSWLGTPEVAALEHYCSQGWSGSWCEGGAIQAILKALCFDLLVDLNRKNSFDTANRYFKALLHIYKSEIPSLCNQVESVPLSAGLQNFAEIKSHYFGGMTYRSVTAEHFSLLYAAIGRQKLKTILASIGEDPYEFCKGWPDLTLVRSGRVLLAEVKTTDRLHSSQLKTIPTVCQANGLDVVVIRIVPHQPRSPSIRRPD
jgi:hypothetical protein